MSRLCSGSQYSVEANWMGQLEVTVQYVVWWGVSVEGHIRGRKGVLWLYLYFAFGIIVFVSRSGNFVRRASMFVYKLFWCSVTS